MQNSRPGMLLCMGNPLLDISAQADDQFLKKYDLLPNNAILADAKHEPLYEDLIKNHKAEFTAGGAALNTARIAQIILKTVNVVVYMGCISDDEYGKILEEKARSDGVDTRFQYTHEKPTGTSAVIISKDGKSRSIVANLSASQMFTIKHIETPENKKVIENAQYFYITGYFICVSPDTALSVAMEALKNKKVSVLNLSAPYVCEFYHESLTKLLPFVDIVFGNESEALAFSKQFRLATECISEIALKMSKLHKYNESRKKLVVITQGDLPVIVADGSRVREFEVMKLPQDKVIDTNGAGDAFVGGFLSQLILQQPYETCVKCGIWAASEIIQQSGCALRADAEFSI
ncbi:uncharacterized protein LOC135840267 isoform X2 [Planococcus citri]|uniref:uncharacterized protein LOC135840267 isoform X2 n=1 Tax=Planococcus citri TaxID=170843 RepID=UPI0031F749BC